ncbi:hypothetical protein KIL84_003541 [Mauremys mutica]|uniref:MHC class II alpha chain N-terminal domain-containing protein n=1 Tax=Mauremys mutica TaxID=74926 RepID=A0A9D4ARA9_9SAUR|nr:hypothetical protein KIL84_003541 [Mauremys mutica]
MPVAEAGAGAGEGSWVAFYQLMDPAQREAGEFMFEFDQDEIFHMNLKRKETIWRLPNFGKFTSFEAQRALGNITMLKKNMEIMIQRSNRRRAQNGMTNSRQQRGISAEHCNPNHHEFKQGAPDVSAIAQVGSFGGDGRSPP